MGIADIMGVPGVEGMDPALQKYLKEQQLLGTLQGILSAGAPSRIPTNASQVVSGGLGGAMQGQQSGLANIMAGQKMADAQAQAQQKKAFTADIGKIPTTQQMDVPMEQLGLGVPYAPMQKVEVPRPDSAYVQDVARTAMKYDPFKGAEMYKDLGMTGAKPQAFSPRTIEKVVNGKKHYFSMDPTNGQYTVDQGEVPSQEYKIQRSIGRGGITKRQIIQDPNTGEPIYQDSLAKGTREAVPQEDLAGLRPITVRGLDSGQTSELANLKNTFDRLGSVAEKADKMPEKFGPLSGRWAQLKIKFANEGPTQRVANELKSMITIAYGLSGKQISEKEMELLKEAMLPALEQPYQNFQATLNFAKDWVGNLHDDRVQYFEQNMFDTNTPLLVKGKKPKPSGNGGMNIGGYTVKIK